MIKEGNYVSEHIKERILRKVNNMIKEGILCKVNNMI